ncbi:MAG: DUF58 domain-containing protein [Sedimentibacter sp.]
MKNYKVRDEGVFLFNDVLFRSIVVICLIISLTANALLMSTLCICILALSFGTKLWAGAGLKNLTAAIKLDGIRAFPGDIIHSKINIQNNKILPVSLKIELSKNINEHYTMESGILSYGDIVFDLDLSYEKRGVYTLGPLYISAFDLLGFYSVGSNFTDIQEIIIYPKLISLKECAYTSREYFGDNDSSSFVEDPVLVTGTREYTYGHSSKNINWKASAKTMTLQEKMFAPSSHIKLVLIIDVKEFKKEQDSDEFEQMLSVVGSLVVALSKINILPGLIVNGSMQGEQNPGIFSVDKSENISVLLEKLSRLTMEFNQDYDNKIQQLDFYGNTTYIYFCYSLNEKMNDFKNNNPTIEIVTCRQVKQQKNLSMENIHNITNWIEIGDNK